MEIQRKPHFLVRLFRRAKAHRGPEFASRVVKAAYARRYANKAPKPQEKPDA